MSFSITSGRAELVEQKEHREFLALSDTTVIILIFISVAALVIGSYFASSVLFTSAMALKSRRKHTRHHLTLLVDEKLFWCSFNPTSLEAGDAVEVISHERDENKEVAEAYALKIPSKGHLWTKFDMRIDKEASEKFIFKTVPKLFAFMLVVFLAAIASFNVVAFGASSLGEVLPFNAVMVVCVGATLMCLIIMKLLHVRADIPNRKQATALFDFLGFKTPESVSHYQYNTTFIESWEKKNNKAFPTIEDGTVFYLEPTQSFN